MPAWTASAPRKSCRTVRKRDISGEVWCVCVWSVLHWPLRPRTVALENALCVVASPAARNKKPRRTRARGGGREARLYSHDPMISP